MEFYARVYGIDGIPSNNHFLLAACYSCNFLKQFNENVDFLRYRTSCLHFSKSFLNLTSPYVNKSFIAKVCKLNTIDSIFGIMMNFGNDLVGNKKLIGQRFKLDTDIFIGVTSSSMTLYLRCNLKSHI